MAPAESKVTEDGVVVPLGKPKEEPSKRVRSPRNHVEYRSTLINYAPPLWLQGSLLYNEYIVYNIDQIRMRYVLHVSFNFKRR